jgi:hypothetical protein
MFDFLYLTITIPGDAHFYWGVLAGVGLTLFSILCMAMLTV